MSAFAGELVEIATLSASERRRVMAHTHDA